MNHIGATPIISAKNLTISLADDGSDRPPAMVYDLDLSVMRGECVGLVGESGSGKSLTGLAMLNLLPSGVVMSAGDLRFGDHDLRTLPEKQLRKLRGKNIAMVFQDPSSALNPTRTIKKQLVDIIRTHEKLSHSKAVARAISALEDVGFANARERLDAFPFQLSGGLKQRVSIAMALACKPELVIADEPTTNLDVSVQAGILNLLRNRIETDGFACVFVSHDLGVIGTVADRVMVMYGGQIVESGPVDQVLNNPQHLYTRGLISAAPNMQSTRDNPLRSYAGLRLSLSSTRAPSELRPSPGEPEHFVRHLLEDPSICKKGELQ